MKAETDKSATRVVLISTAIAIFSLVAIVVLALGVYAVNRRDTRIIPEYGHTDYGDISTDHHFRIYVDDETGVNYIFYYDGENIVFVPRYDSRGKIKVSNMIEKAK